MPPVPAQSLAQRAYRSIASSLIALAAMIFLPAWTLRYWQGWLFLAVFGLSAAAVTAYLLRHDPALVERRMAVGAKAEKQPSQKRIQAFASIFVLLLLLFPGFDRRFGWSADIPALAIFGEAMVIAGFVAIFVVFRENSFAFATIETVDSQPVIDTGPYAVVRHPMYAGALVLIAGVPLALGSIWGLLVWPFLVATIVQRLLEEERYLATSLPGYSNYCQRVRARLVPGLY